MWWFIGTFIASLVLASMMTPKAQKLQPSEFSAPTITEGKEFPVLFGTRDIEDMFVGWWGNTRTVAIKKKGGKK